MHPQAGVSQIGMGLGATPVPLEQAIGAAKGFWDWGAGGGVGGLPRCPWRSWGPSATSGHGVSGGGDAVGAVPARCKGASRGWRALQSHPAAVPGGGTRRGRGCWCPPPRCHRVGRVPPAPTYPPGTSPGLGSVLVLLLLPGFPLPERCWGLSGDRGVQGGLYKLLSGFGEGLRAPTVGLGLRLL